MRFLGSNATEIHMLVAGGLPWTLMGELTALPRPSWLELRGPLGVR